MVVFATRVRTEGSTNFGKSSRKTYILCQLLVATDVATTQCAARPLEPLLALLQPSSSVAFGSLFRAYLADAAKCAAKKNHVELHL